MATTRTGEYLESPRLTQLLAKGTWNQLGTPVQAAAATQTEQTFRAISRSKNHLIAVQAFRAHQPFRVIALAVEYSVKSDVKAGDDA